MTADFMREIPQQSFDISSENYPTPTELTSNIKSALSEAGFNEAEINEVIRPINDAKSVKRLLLSGSNANAIARANAFPDFVYIDALFDDKSLFNQRSKTYELPLSPEYLLSLVDTNPTLLELQRGRRSAI